MFPLEQGAFEMLLIGAIALIVVGPKDLPMLMRKVGQFTAKMRGLAAEFRASFDEMARQSELDDLRREVEALRTGVSSSLSHETIDHDPGFNPGVYDGQGPPTVPQEPKALPVADGSSTSVENSSTETGHGADTSYGQSLADGQGNLDLGSGDALAPAHAETAGEPSPAPPVRAARTRRKPPSAAESETPTKPAAVSRRRTAATAPTEEREG